MVLSESKSVGRTSEFIRKVTKHTISGPINNVNVKFEWSHLHLPDFFYLNVHEVSFVLKNRHILAKNVDFFNTFSPFDSCQAILNLILIVYGFPFIKYFTYNRKKKFEKKLLHGLGLKMRGNLGPFRFFNAFQPWIKRSICKLF